MKKLLILSTLAAGLMAAPSAEANTKVAFVDTAKVINGFYETQNARNQMRKAMENLNEELKGRAENPQKLAAEINTIRQDLQKPELSEQVKRQKFEEGQKKEQDFLKQRKELEEYARSRQSNLQEQEARMLKGIYEKVEATVHARVKAEGYDLVVNISAADRGGLPVVLYSNPAADITEKVLADLNKDAPKDLPAQPAKEEAKKDGAKKDAKTDKKK